MKTIIRCFLICISLCIVLVHQGCEDAPVTKKVKDTTTTDEVSRVKMQTAMDTEFVYYHPETANMCVTSISYKGKRYTIMYAQGYKEHYQIIATDTTSFYPKFTKQ